MTDIDDRIRGALDEDDKAFLDSLESERGLFRQIGDSWKGPMGGWAKFAFAMSLVFGGLMLAVIVAAIRSFFVAFRSSAFTLAFQEFTDKTLPATE